MFVGCLYVYLGLLPIFDWVVLFFFLIELHDLFVYFGNEFFVSYFICRCFLLPLRVINTKNNKWDIIKSFSTAKEIVNTMKRQSSE